MFFGSILELPFCMLRCKISYLICGLGLVETIYKPSAAAWTGKGAVVGQIRGPSAAAKTDFHIKSGNFRTEGGGSLTPDHSLLENKRFFVVNFYGIFLPFHYIFLNMTLLSQTLHRPSCFLK